MARQRDHGLDITPELLLRAYAAGIFPMAESADTPTLFWVDPERRGILPASYLENVAAYVERGGAPLIVKRQVILTGENLTDAQPGFDGRQLVEIALTAFERDLELFHGCAQLSRTGIGFALRAVLLVQGVLAFFFNTTLVALTINIASGLL